MAEEPSPTDVLQRGVAKSRRTKNGPLFWWTTSYSTTVCLLNKYSFFIHFLCFICKNKTIIWFPENLLWSRIWSDLIIKIWNSSPIGFSVLFLKYKWKLLNLTRWTYLLNFILNINWIISQCQQDDIIN